MMLPAGTIPIVVSAVLIILIAIFLFKGFLIVPQARTMVIERLGKYHRTLSSGVNIIWPIFDKRRAIQWRYARTDVDEKGVWIGTKTTTEIDLRETVYEFPKQSVITRDNVAIEISAILYFQVTDAKRAVYEIGNLPDAIEKLTQTTLRNVIGGLDLDTALTSRDTVNTKLRTILDEATDKWGVKANRIELQDIIPPDDIKTAMEKQMRAERDRRATILEAEGQKQSRILEAEGIRQSEINKAEGYKQSLVLRAAGEAQARVMVAQAEAKAVETVTKAIEDSGGNPTAYLIALKYIEAMKEMVSGENNKIIYMPYEASALLGSLGTIRDLFATTARTNLPHQREPQGQDGADNKSGT